MIAETSPSRHAPETLPWRSYQQHPLELIPFFRRWKPSALRSYVYTTLICCGVVFAILLVQLSFGEFPSAGLAGVFMAIVPPVLGLYGGFFVSAVLLGGGAWYGWLLNRNNLIANSIIVMAVAWFIWYSAAAREKLQAARLAQAQAAAKAEAAKRETAVADLKALRAQVEPHFLYNTLANVVSLIDRDAPQAKRMTERLIGYLRNTLDASRRDAATLGDELAIIGDYLEILRLRMGARLSYCIDVEPDVKSLSLPPMLLQPLVENAIKHGLEPNIDGGQIRIHATRTDETLRIAIDDNGLGFGMGGDTAGSGSGLANVRARLAAIFGDAARLIIESPVPMDHDTARPTSAGVPPTGTRITILIKLNVF
jgi:hypothetical protein